MTEQVPAGKKTIASAFAKFILRNVPEKLWSRVAEDRQAPGSLHLQKVDPPKIGLEIELDQMPPKIEANAPDLPASLKGQFNELWQKEIKKLLDQQDGRITQLEEDLLRLSEVFYEAYEKITEDPDRFEEHEIDDDWLSRFIKYASEIRDEDILEILARALADAATRPKSKLSPKALDTLRFFQQDTFANFKASAGLIASLRQVPIQLFDNEDRLGIVDFNLEAMIEMGLLKIETTSVYSLLFGDVILNFKYKSSERFAFETIKLTTVGTEILNLTDANFRDLPSALSMSAAKGQLASLQQAVQLSSAMVRNVALCLLQEMGNRWAIESSILLRTGSGNKLVYSGERAEMANKFKISVDETNLIELDDKQAKATLLDILQEFEGFDEYQLPAIIEAESHN
ncbi:hypothetical protein J2045_001315 [Peteryoungia aggregata LMG 23059]|uniref:Uncharacterized protein n=1 Tax=Peteryoungia aggregata LMG 23059 TaxID=1368425 RepID=A0ABU0G4P6_9HYPH|nr:DUF2806 domain-containing protein [Peteryoungia aggregata]MDQ0420296.1 hypothetical protein [Peteryoungia aggregata LMG 23059]